MSTDYAYTTICFEGDVRKLKSNPFKVQSGFGKVAVVSVGDAFEEIESLHDEIDRLQKKLDQYE